MTDEQWEKSAASLERRMDKLIDQIELLKQENKRLKENVLILAFETRFSEITDKYLTEATDRIAYTTRTEYGLTGPAIDLVVNNFKDYVIRNNREEE